MPDLINTVLGLLKAEDKPGLDPKKIFLAAIFLFVFLYADSAFFIKPQLKGIKNSGIKIMKLKSDINNLNKDLAEMKRLMAAPDSLKLKAGRKPKEIIREEEIPSLLQYISNTANKSNIRVMQLKPSRDIKEVKQKGAPAAPDDKIAPLFIALEFSCDYHGLGRFLNDLERGNFFLSLESLKIKGGSADYFKQETDMVLRTYVKK